MKTTYQIPARQVINKHFVSYVCVSIKDDIAIIIPNQIYLDDQKHKVRSHFQLMIPFSCYSELLNKATFYFNSFVSIMMEAKSLAESWKTRLPRLIDECRAFVLQKETIVQVTQPAKPLTAEDLRKIQEQVLRAGVDEEERMRMFEEKKGEAIRLGAEFQAAKSSLEYGRLKLEQLELFQDKLTGVLGAQLLDLENEKQILTRYNDQLTEFKKAIIDDQVKIYSNESQYQRMQMLQIRVSELKSYLWRLLNAYTSVFKVELEMKFEDYTLDKNDQIQELKIQIITISAEAQFQLAEMGNLEEKIKLAEDYYQVLLNYDQEDRLQECLTLQNGNMMQVQSAFANLTLDPIHDRVSVVLNNFGVNSTSIHYYSGFNFSRQVPCFDYKDPRKFKKSIETTDQLELIKQFREKYAYLSDQLTVAKALQQRSRLFQQEIKQRQKSDRQQIKTLEGQLKTDKEIFEALTEFCFRDPKTMSLHRHSMKALIGAFCRNLCIQREPTFLCCSCKCCEEKSLHSYNMIDFSDLISTMCSEILMNTPTQRGCCQKAYEVVTKCEDYPITYLENLIIHLQIIGAYRRQDGTRQQGAFQNVDIDAAIARTVRYISLIIIADFEVQKNLNVCRPCLAAFERMADAGRRGEYASNFYPL